MRALREWVVYRWKMLYQNYRQMSVIMHMWSILVVIQPYVGSIEHVNMFPFIFRSIRNLYFFFVIWFACSRSVFSIYRTFLLFYCCRLCVCVFHRFHHFLSGQTCTILFLLLLLCDAIFFCQIQQSLTKTSEHSLSDLKFHEAYTNRTRLNRLNNFFQICLQPLVTNLVKWLCNTHAMHSFRYRVGEAKETK